MKQPTNSSGKFRYSEKVSHVVKSRYGARQAGEIWGSHLHGELAEWNFKQSSYDQRLYYLVRNNLFRIPIIVVDNMASASNSSVLLDNFEHQLSTTF